MPLQLGHPILQNKKLSPGDLSVTKVSCGQPKQHLMISPFQSLPFSPIPSSSSNSLPPVLSPSSPPNKQPNPQPPNKKSPIPQPNLASQLAQTSPAAPPAGPGPRPPAPGPRPPNGVRTYHPPRHRPSMEASAARVEADRDSPLICLHSTYLPSRCHKSPSHTCRKVKAEGTFS